VSVVTTEVAEEHTWPSSRWVSSFSLFFFLFLLSYTLYPDAIHNYRQIEGEGRGGSCVDSMASAIRRRQTSDV